MAMGIREREIKEDFDDHGDDDDDDTSRRRWATKPAIAERAVVWVWACMATVESRRRRRFRVDAPLLGIVLPSFDLGKAHRHLCCVAACGVCRVCVCMVVCD